MSALATYLTGWVLIVIGLAFGAYLLNVPAPWVLVASAILVAGGIVALTWRRKPPDNPSA